MEPTDFILAARVPETVETDTFGLWTIHRHRGLDIAKVGFDSMTILSRMTEATQHLRFGETVMEDSRRELSRHLPIWLNAKDRVLITGLGLGCVLRGLLASDRVHRVDVIEKDMAIIDRIWPEFQRDSRASIHCGDALTIDLPGIWDWAWHDIWTDEERHLQLLHADLMARFKDRVRHQGAWNFPRLAKRLMGGEFLELRLGSRP